jgi:beta-galactosidase
MVHILPYWNWPKRIGKITPVHVFTSGDETERFLNGKSLGRKKKKQCGIGCDETVNNMNQYKFNLYGFNSPPLAANQK